MGRHDVRSHKLHIPKRAKFIQPKPNAVTNHSTDAPQKPQPGTNAYNMFR
jgi:hypothetical protein